MRRKELSRYDNGKKLTVFLYANSFLAEFSDLLDDYLVSLLLIGTSSVPATAWTTEKGIRKSASEEYSTVAEQTLGTRGHQ